MKSIKEKKMFLLDMDGTIYHENTLIDGAKDFLETILKDEHNYVFMTNNSSKGKKAYVEKLTSLGIQSTTDNIVSSVNATIAYLKKNKQNPKIYLVGTESFKNELINEGVEIVPVNYRNKDIDYVVVGFDTELTYDKIEGACYFIDLGIKYIATNCDLKCPVKGGKYIPDCGAICKMIELATGKSPLYLGKPDSYIVDYVLKQWNLKKEDVICIGDRLYTDIAIGINAGVETAVVLTGEATLEDIQKSNYKPTYVFQSVKDI
ncbi:MAG: HAD-IIA family hydrolase, partial [Bacteroidales bacterium]|nr:HAD-IIA family hydrolase [Bacteroidales bacterium]